MSYPFTKFNFPRLSPKLCSNLWSSNKNWQNYHILFPSILVACDLKCRHTHSTFPSIHSKQVLQWLCLEVKKHFPAGTEGPRQGPHSIPSTIRKASELMEPHSSYLWNLFLNNSLKRHHTHPMAKWIPNHALANTPNLQLSHTSQIYLHRLIRCDEREHEMKTRAAGRSQQGTASAEERERGRFSLARGTYYIHILWANFPFSPINV